MIRLMQTTSPEEQRAQAINAIKDSPYWPANGSYEGRRFDDHWKALRTTNQVLMLTDRLRIAAEGGGHQVINHDENRTTLHHITSDGKLIIDDTSRVPKYTGVAYSAEFTRAYTDQPQRLRFINHHTLGLTANFAYPDQKHEPRVVVARKVRNWRHVAMSYVATEPDSTALTLDQIDVGFGSTGGKTSNNTMWWQEAAGISNSMNTLRVRPASGITYHYYDRDRPDLPLTSGFSFVIPNERPEISLTATLDQGINEFQLGITERSIVIGGSRQQTVTFTPRYKGQLMPVHDLGRQTFWDNKSQVAELFDQLRQLAPRSTNYQSTTRLGEEYV